MQFNPNVEITVQNNVLTVKDISNYDTNDEGYRKADLFVRTVTVSDAVLGLNSVTKPLTYSNDSTTFDLTLLSTVAVKVTLYVYGAGSGFNQSKDFVKYINI